MPGPGVLDLSFVMDLESRWRIIQVDSYSAFQASENAWWSLFTSKPPSASRREIYLWILDTATIEPTGQGGNLAFDDMVILEAEYVNNNAGKGLEIRKNQFTDLDGNGVKVGTEWVRQVSAYGGYWPQKQVSKLWLAGETGIGYDGVPFFSKNHPCNPQDLGAGVYANIFTGAASAGYPGALPLDESVTLDVAFANLTKGLAYIRSVKMPNGEDPRFLVPKYLAGPPAMRTRMSLLTGAKFFALQSTGGAGTADMEGTIRKWGLSEPVEIPEFATIDDTSCYVVCEQLTQSEISTFAYFDREPFAITYYTGSGGGTGVDAILDRTDRLEWHTKGRNVAGYGHPYTIFKFKAT